MSVVLYGLRTGDWRPLIERWRSACLESFRTLPDLPEPIKVSEYAKQRGISVKEARKELIRREYFELSRQYFIEYHPCVLTLMNLARKQEQKFKVRISVVSLIKGIRKLKCEILEPTSTEICRILGPYTAQKLISLGILKAIELPHTYKRKKVFYYATNILSR